MRISQQINSLGTLGMDSNTKQYFHVQETTVTVHKRWITLAQYLFKGNIWTRVNNLQNVPL